MSMSKVLAVSPVSDFDAAVDWYERLLGRPPDARPMGGLADWHLTDSAWIQLFQNVERAGGTLLNLAVDDLDEQLAELATRGITGGEISSTDKGARLSTVTDPDGNRITLIENPTT